MKKYNVLCRDGKIRMATVGEPNTWFSAPARVQAFGKTVTGFVASDDGKLTFVAYTSGKNAGVIPNLLCDMYQCHNEAFVHVRTEKVIEYHYRSSATGTFMPEYGNVCYACSGKTYLWD